MAIHYNLPGLIFILIWYGWSFPAINAVQKNIDQGNKNRLLTLAALFLGPIVWLLCITKSILEPRIILWYKKNLIKEIPIDFLDEKDQKINFITKENNIIKGAAVCGKILFDLISHQALQIICKSQAGNVSLSYHIDDQWFNGGVLNKKDAVLFKRFLEECAGLAFGDNSLSVSGALSFSLASNYFTITFHGLKNAVEERIAGKIEQKTAPVNEEITIVKDGVPQEAALIKLPTTEELGLPENVLSDFLSSVKAQSGVSIIASPRGEGKSLLLQSLCNNNLFANASTIYISATPVQLPNSGSIFVMEETHAEKLPELILDAANQMPDYLIIDEMENVGVASILHKVLENNIKVIVTLRADHALNALARFNSLDWNFDDMGKFLNAILCRRMIKRPTGEIISVYELFCPGNELKQIMTSQRCTLSQIVKFLAERKLDNELFTAALQLAERGIITMAEAQKLDRKREQLLKQTF